MKWFFGWSTAAEKRYRNRMGIAMALYLVLLMACVKLVRLEPIHGWLLYVIAMVPAVPVLAVLVIVARYLHEEKDEFLRMLATRSLLIATGALLGTIVVNDFLRVIAHGAAIDPFICFIIFFVAFGIAQGVQKIAARGGADE